jgi:hypothetical protein
LTGSTPKPLVVLTADKDAHFAVRELLRRPADFGIRPTDFDIFAHPHHDNGVVRKAHDFLRPFLKWRHALVIFDHEGCGREADGTETVQRDLEERMAANGWAGRCRAIAIAPELEAWVWDACRQANRLLRWPGGTDRLNRWIEERRYAAGGEIKPCRPKEAFLDALRERDIKRSSALYADLARDFDFRGCEDPAFVRLASTLRSWFPRA